MGLDLCLQSSGSFTDLEFELELELFSLDEETTEKENGKERNLPQVLNIAMAIEEFRIVCLL